MEAVVKKLGRSRRRFDRDPPNDERRASRSITASSTDTSRAAFSLTLKRRLRSDGSVKESCSSQIRKRFRFEAAHTLPFHPGKCARMHGHSYRLEVAVSGPIRTRWAGARHDRRFRSTSSGSSTSAFCSSSTINTSTSSSTIRRSKTSFFGFGSGSKQSCCSSTKSFCGKPRLRAPSSAAPTLAILSVSKGQTHVSS